MDLKSIKNDSSRRKYIRLELNKDIYNALKDKYEMILLEDELSITNENGDEVVKFSKGDILVNVGEVIDKDGFTVDAVAHITSCSKSWNNTKQRNCRVTFGDILDALEETES